MARLDLAFHQRVTMVVAPAGFGKTEALAQWAAKHPAGRVRWITIAEEHQRRGRLLHDLRAVLTSSRDLGDVALVIDDFQRLTDDKVAIDLASVIEITPPWFHVVVASRTEPPLAYYRVGLTDVQVELRDDALAFDLDEVAELLRRTSGADVEPSRVESLFRRTGGWPVAVRLAVTADAVDEVDRFADFLDEHVVGPEPPGVRDFLASTCVLRSLNAPLCDAVTERRDGDAMLDHLRRASLLSRRRDDGRGGDRRAYHELLRRHLRRRLHDEDPARERAVLVQAAGWHLARDEFDAGMAYLIDAGAWNEVFAAAFEHSPRLLGAGNATSVARWLAKVPPDVRVERPDVLLLEAASRLFGSEPARAEAALEAVEGLSSVSPQERVVADLLRGYLALQRGSVWQAVAASDRVRRGVTQLGDDGFDGPNVLGLTGCRDDVLAAAGVMRGVGLVYEGRLTEARQSLGRSLIGCHAVWQVSALGALALLEAWSGRLVLGEQLAIQALAIAEELSLSDQVITTSAFLAIATVAREREELDRARAFLDEAAGRSGPGQSLLVASAVAIEQALLATAAGDPGAGLRTLAARPEGNHPSMPSAVVVRRRAVEARLLLLSGDSEAAERMLATVDGSDSPELASIRMRLAVERRDVGAARAIGDSWPDESTPRVRIEARVWRAILAYLDGDEAGARSEMAAAVAEAEPEQDLGPFRLAGPHVLGPARALYRTTPTPFLRSIVEQPTPASAARVSAQLVEQLTHREYLVLSLLPTRLSNSEIAEQLEVSLNTVKTHLKHIYRKLDVPGRREAVGSAEHLRLL